MWHFWVYFLIPFLGYLVLDSHLGYFFRERNPPPFFGIWNDVFGRACAEKKKEELVTFVNHEHLRWPKLYISSPHPRVRHAEPLFPDSAAWLVPLPIIISVPRMCMMFHVCCMQSLYRQYRLRQWSSSIQPFHNRVCIHDTYESVCNHRSLVRHDRASGVYVTRVMYGNHVGRVKWGPRLRGHESTRHVEISCFP